MKVALAALRRARSFGSLEETLGQEFRVSLRCFAAPDLAEGIRAQVIDKDRSPRWQPARLDDVGEERVRSYFAPLGSLPGEERVPELGLADRVASPATSGVSR